MWIRISKPQGQQFKLQDGGTNRQTNGTLGNIIIWMLTQPTADFLQKYGKRLSSEVIKFKPTYFGFKQTRPLKPA